DNFREHDYFPGYFVHYDEYSFTLQTNNAYSYFKWNGEKFTVAASNSNSYDTMEEISAKGTNIIKELYNKYVLGDENPTNENLKKYCTDKMIKYLWDQYSYDGEDIAIWCFRGNCHTEIMSAKITEIENLQGGFFRVHYVNGQEKEAYYCDVCAVLENGNVLIDSIVK
ncbi:MAG: hypothetical protein J5882_05370, partial [Bacteroidales bacterium]|nr:hypothetical protein [Bacteroidales bacterium]